MDILHNAIDFLVAGIFTEVFSIGFLIGLVLFVIGLGLLVLFLLSRIMGYRTQGTVVGAIMQTRTKTKVEDGKPVERVKKMLLPVYAYRAKDGSMRQMPGSEGGSMTTEYCTGQNVNLIVREDELYDDVYDADRYGALYLGLGFFTAGLALMVWFGSFAATLGISALTLTVALGARLYAGLSNKPTKKNAPQKKPYDKAFSPADLRPIEEFQ